MTVKIHPVQTGSVKVRTAQRARKRGGLLRVLTDSEWTEWLPIFAWVIEHPEGIIVVDTGETAKTGTPGYFPRWHPYYRRAVRMDVQPDQEIGPQLRKMGIVQDDVKILILTHFHTDHAGGLHHFPESEILVSGDDLQMASGFAGRMLGYLPHHWPAWFAPTPIPFADDAFGLFGRSYHVTKANDVIVVPTPGHTPGHLSVIVRSEDLVYFLAGDTSYNERFLVQRTPDGVSPNASITLDTMDRILSLADVRPVVYLPSHDPASAERLRAKRTLVKTA